MLNLETVWVELALMGNHWGPVNNKITIVDMFLLQLNKHCGREQESMRFLFGILQISGLVFRPTSARQWDGMPLTPAPL